MTQKSFIVGTVVAYILWASLALVYADTRQVRVQWTNPTVLATGEPLTDLAEIKLCFRFTEIEAPTDQVCEQIETVSTTEVGKEMTWVGPITFDTNSTHIIYVYAIAERTGGAQSEMASAIPIPLADVIPPEKVQNLQSVIRQIIRFLLKNIGG